MATTSYSVPTASLTRILIHSMTRTRSNRWLGSRTARFATSRETQDARRGDVATSKRPGLSRVKSKMHKHQTKRRNSEKFTTRFELRSTHFRRTIEPSSKCGLTVTSPGNRLRRLLDFASANVGNARPQFWPNSAGDLVVAGSPPGLDALRQSVLAFRRRSPSPGRGEAYSHTDRITTDARVAGYSLRPCPAPSIRGVPFRVRERKHLVF